MSPSAIRRSEPRSLDWGTQHFRFPVAEVVGPHLDDTDLAKALAVARNYGMRLVYWSASPERSPAAKLLAKFNGRRVDRKATYVLDLAAPGRAQHDREARVVALPRGPAPPPLLALGVAAGVYSRFRRDCWIPQRDFERLYEIWMDRSSLGELAEIVLVALPQADDGPILGVVTVLAHEQAGQIGLLAVHSAARGRGISSTLVAAAHEWMAANGLARSRVVTQRDNQAACHLYERAGYRLVDLVHLYHFWPLGPVPEREAGAWPES